MPDLDPVNTIRKSIKKHFSHLTIIEYPNRLNQGIEWTVVAGPSHYTINPLLARDDNHTCRLLIRMASTTNPIVRIWSRFPWRGEYGWRDIGSENTSCLDMFFQNLQAQTEQSFISLLRFTTKLQMPPNPT